MAQGLLRTVQGNAIVVAQAIVLKHAFKFHQLGEYGIAVHGVKLDDSATGVSPERPADTGHAAPPGHAKCATRGALPGAWERLKRFRRSYSGDGHQKLARTGLK